ncbi:MAG: alpha/beta hydrolase [Actinobacteria bacterium]|nr:alpha/beta hydrolase [Actinomycetota bacterium]
MRDHTFRASDRATLHYLRGGAGPTVLFLPGAGFSAELFTRQLDHFATSFDVISLDKRGHGDSEPVSHGYRVSRFAKDLRDLLEALDLHEVNLVAHSLGAAMVYNYVSLYGTERLNSLVVVDEPAVLLRDPAWSDDVAAELGAVYEPGELHALTAGFSQPDNSELLTNIVDNMTTPQADDATKDFIRSCLRIPGPAATKLFFNNISQDFRDVLPLLDIPVLFITGRGSIHPWRSHEWMRDQVPGSRLFVFEEEQGGNHFPMVENPTLFNEVLAEFLADVTA